MLGPLAGDSMRGAGPVLTLTALALLLAALPDLMRRLELGPQPGPTFAASAAGSARPRVEPALRPLALLEGGLLQRLKRADQAWIPRAETLPEGGTRYVYRRRPGESELTLPQIRALIANPPSHEREHRVIVNLLTTLERVGVGLGLLEPIKVGAAAEWDPQARLLRLRPDVPDQGSLELARVLNHEAIHVAQSCAAGAVGATPRPLGIVAAGLSASGHPASRGGSQAKRSGASITMPQLSEPLYADLNPAERRMEEEAYSLQNRLDLGVKLLRIHCQVGQAG